MNRWIAIAATALVVGCHHPAGTARPSETADAHAIAVARLEGSRGAGLGRLVELARGDDALAIRALGRVGGPTAIAALVSLLPDARAAQALGIACSLDEPTAAQQAALASQLRGRSPAVDADPAGRSPELYEAMGRCGDRSVEAIVSPSLGGGAEPVAVAAAIALGRLGRRKIALAPEVRAALVATLADHRVAVRYAATWAIAREAEPPKDPATIAALAGVLARDPDPETRAQAALALAHEHAVTDDAARPAVLAAIADRDWRVQVEAARGLAASDRAADREAALTATSPHAALEALANLTQRVLPEERSRALPPAVATADGIARAWLDCRRAAVDTARRARGIAALVAGGCQALPAAYRAAIAAELLAVALPEAFRATVDGEAFAVHDHVDAEDDRLAVVRGLVASPELRVTMAGIGAIASLAPAQQPLFAADVVAALADRRVTLAGAAVDAAEPLLATSPAVAQAVLARARIEQDPDLAVALFGLIEKHPEGPLADGREVCRTAASGPVPAVAAAALACFQAFRDLGATPAPPPPAADPRPLVVPREIDVATVIGKHLVWKLTTTRGDIAIALHPEIAPHAVAMIVALTAKQFYDGLDFHRVVPDFVVQGGDPTMTGGGGPGFTIPAEPGGAFATGGVGIADSGRDTGGSQWFIMHARAPHLDGRYTWFGQVTAGQDVADALQIGDRVLHAEIVTR